MVQSPPVSPSSTVTPPSETRTVHVPAPSMAKTYELFIPAVLPGSIRDGSLSKNSLTRDTVGLLVDVGSSLSATGPRPPAPAVGALRSEAGTRSAPARRAE